MAENMVLKKITIKQNDSDSETPAVFGVDATNVDIISNNAQTTLSARVQDWDNAATIASNIKLGTAELKVSSLTATSKLIIGNNTNVYFQPNSTNTIDGKIPIKLHGAPFYASTIGCSKLIGVSNEESPKVVEVQDEVRCDYLRVQNEKADSDAQWLLGFGKGSTNLGMVRKSSQGNGIQIHSNNGVGELSGKWRVLSSMQLTQGLQIKPATEDNHLIDFYTQGNENFDGNLANIQITQDDEENFMVALSGSWDLSQVSVIKNLENRLKTLEGKISGQN